MLIVKLKEDILHYWDLYLRFGYIFEIDHVNLCSRPMGGCSLSSYGLVFVCCCAVFGQHVYEINKFPWFLNEMKIKYILHIDRYSKYSRGCSHYQP